LKGDDSEEQQNGKPQNSYKSESTDKDIKGDECGNGDIWKRRLDLADQRLFFSVCCNCQRKSDYNEQKLCAQKPYKQLLTIFAEHRRAVDPGADRPE